MKEYKGFQFQKTVADHIKTMESALQYYRAFQVYLPLTKALESLALVELPVFPATEYEDGKPLLNFYYRGQADTEEEGREDLAEIMKMLRTIFKDIRYRFDTAYNEHGYAGYYDGDSKIMTTEVVIRLYVPWLPSSCQIVWEEPEQKFYIQERSKSASVVCPSKAIVAF